MKPEQVVPLIVAVPLSSAAILAGTGKLLPRRLVDSISLLTALIATACSCFVFIHAYRQPIVYWFGGWQPRDGVAVGISFYADPVSLSLCVLTGTLTCMALLYSWRYFESAGSHYHALMLVLCAAICGFVLTSDLFNLFVFLELSTVSAVALSAYHAELPGPLQGAWNFGVIATTGAVLFLTGLSLLYGHTGALNFAQAGISIAKHPDPLVLVAFAFMACGVLIKDGVTPFHFWLADANAAAATPACIMFSGVMVEVGAIVLIRLYVVLFSTAFGDREWAVSAVLLGFGTVTAVLGGIMCLLQQHLKRLLAYSTISHVGLVLLAGALLVPEGIGGSVLYLIAHGLVLAALFICAGVLQQRFGTDDQMKLHGRARGLYSLLAVYVLGALALAAAPPFLTAPAEELVVGSAYHQGREWVSWIFSFAAIVTAGAILRSAGAVFFGWGSRERHESDEHSSQREAESGGRSAEKMMLLPGALLIAFSICLTFTPGLDHIVLRAASDFRDGATIRNRIMRSTQAPLVLSDTHREKELSEEPAIKKYGVEKGCINVTAAMLLALLALYSDRLRLTKSKLLTRPASLLRAIHSGAVGDYAAWLTAGVAIFSGLMLLFFCT